MTKLTGHFATVGFFALSALLGASTAGCAAASAMGVSKREQRDFEVNNKSKEAICSVDVFNPGQVMKGDRINQKIDIKAGEQKTVKLDVPLDQTRTYEFKSCKDKVLKAQSIPWAPTLVHVDVE